MKIDVNMKLITAASKRIQCSGCQNIESMPSTRSVTFVVLINCSRVTEITKKSLKKLQKGDNKKELNRLSDDLDT